LGFNIDYLYYKDRNPHDYINRYEYTNQPVSEELIDLKKTTPINMVVAQSDYGQKLGKNSKLEFGVKGTISRLKNDVVLKRNTDGTWREDVEFSQDYSLIDDVGAVYVNFNTQLGKKTKIQAGLRGEQTHMELTSGNDSTIFDRSFANLFPTAYISRALTDKNEVQLSYGRRITRPSFTDIAPFVVFLDPTNYYSGNPNLKPTITDGITGNYKFREVYIISLKYTHDRNYLAPFQMKVDPKTNKALSYTTNVDNVNSYTLTMTFPVTVVKWWKMQNNFMGIYQSINTKVEGKKIELDQVNGQFNSSHTFLFPKNFSAELNLFYLTPSRFGLAKLNSIAEVSVGLQKKLPKDMGNITLNISDLFWTGKFKAIYNSPESNSLTTFAGRMEPRVVRLSYSRSFGNKNVKKAAERSGADDAKKRVKVN
jgi:hypothetical protein